jgi:hypothetical protein
MDSGSGKQASRVLATGRQQGGTDACKFDEPRCDETSPSSSRWPRRHGHLIKAKSEAVHEPLLLQNIMPQYFIVYD